MNLTSFVFLLAPFALPVKSSDAFSITHHRGVSNSLSPTSISTKGHRREQTIKLAQVFSLPPLYSSSSSLFGVDSNTSSSSSTSSSGCISDDVMRALAVRGGDTADSTPSTFDKAKKFASKNFFLLGMIVAVSFAKLFPEVRLCVPLLYTCTCVHTLYAVHCSLFGG